VLEARGITYRYAGTDLSSVVDAHISLEEGTTNLLWGDIGAGKTTLAMIMAGVIPHFIKGSLSGTVLWNNRPITKDIVPGLSSYLFQDPQAYLRGPTIREEIELAGVAAERIPELAQLLLPSTSLDTPLAEMSLGQRQRVALCSALLAPTPLVFLDQPFEFLDGSGVDNAAQLIEATTEQGRVTTLVERYRPTADGLQCARAYEVADREVRLGFPIEQPELPRLEAIPGTAPNLVVEGLSFAYRGASRFSLRGVDLSVAERESLAVVGPNGCGKTSLLLLLCGLMRSNRGKVLVRGDRASARALRRAVRCSFENPEAQIFARSVREELEFGLRRLRLGETDISKRLERASRLLPFELSSDPFRLSFGQKKLLCAVATFIAEPVVVLLDEPMAGLDAANAARVRALIDSFLRTGGSVIVSAHRTSEVASISHRVVLMDAGSITDEIVSEQPMETS